MSDIEKETEKITPIEPHPYRLVLGGAAAAIGIYKKPKDSIESAQKALNERMLKILPSLKKSSKILIIGSGAAKTALAIADQYRCKINFFSTNAKTNANLAKVLKGTDFEDHITIDTGTFAHLPYDWENFELVWAQDAFLHYGDKLHLFREVSRVLKPEGRFIFTDPMLTDEYSETKNAELNTFQMETVTDYKKIANTADLERVFIKRMPENLITHYGKVLTALETKLATAKGKNVEILQSGKDLLTQWHAAGEAGHLTWGILLFQKRNI